MKLVRRHSMIGFLAVGLLPALLCANEPIDFARDIRPVLAEHCFACHGPDADQRQAGLRLDLAASAVTRLESGATAIIAGKPDVSELVRRIESTDPDIVMPPPTAKKKLTEDEKAKLRAWVAAGGEYAGHWAFQAPSRPQVPKVADSKWLREPLDAFVLARIELERMTPSAPAPRETLLRRLALDLTGLPPSVADLAEFLTDESPDALERAADRCFASPHYGEKLAQEWLDLGRFGDSSGYQDDNDRPNHPYRDAIIEVCNRNMPFDEFTVASLAGDLLPTPTLIDRILSGFNRLHRYNEEGGSDPDEFRVVYAVDRTNTTAATWMGLTLGCAQCHDHKYDPFTQREYYQLLAFFNSLKDEITVSKGPANPPQIRVPDPTQRARLDQLSVSIAALKTQMAAQIDPADAALQTDLAALVTERAAVENSAPLVLVWEEMETPRSTQLLIRGDYQQPGEEVARDTPAIFPPLDASAPRDRLALATWLVRGDHPLTGRVAANRYWKLVFGDGLVRTPEDFGTRGEPPAHPDLLDWLAVELQADWDVKRMLRRLTNSATYRQSSAVSMELRERDPHNRLLARGPRYRLSAEEIRDAALMASGLLTRKIGGRSVYPYQPEHFYRDKEDDPNEWKWKLETGPDLYRRGLYTFIRRTSPYPAFQAFDVSGRGECTIARARTNTPLQALVTLNDPVFVESARVLAERVLSSAGEDVASRITFVFQAVLTRSPTDKEAEIVHRLYEAELVRYRSDSAAAESVRSLGSAPQTEGLDAAEVAAWTAVANAVLNLDETITRE